jgi:glyoxylase-like metal-dependent hydrolase (beta-lactamase superfamily II)
VWGALDLAAMPGLRAELDASGYAVGDQLVDALPTAGYDVTAYALEPWVPTRTVAEGDRIDLGDRSFEVLHLPGHSPGCIGLWDEVAGVLFSGDAVYDGELLDQLEDSDVTDYVATMERLRELPVEVVHGGHCPSFGRRRLVELCDAYLRMRRP